MNTKILVINEGSERELAEQLKETLIKIKIVFFET